MRRGRLGLSSHRNVNEQNDLLGLVRIDGLHAPCTEIYQLGGEDALTGGSVV